MNKLLIVGTVAFDAIETPFGKTDKILGGSAPYIGLSASQFDTASAIVSVVGGDFPETHLELFRQHNIDISGIEIISSGKTFFWSGRYHNDMNTRDTLSTELNVLSDFQPVVPSKFKDANVVVLGNLHPLVQSSVLDQVTNKEALIIFDTINFWMEHTLEELKEVIKRVDVVTINDEEARQLSGQSSLVAAARKIHAMGPKYVVIKKGEHSALLFSVDNVFFAPALPLEEVFDPTGAGDTFAGGFAGFLSKTNNFTFENMKKAVVYGSALASFTVEKFGTERISDLSSKEVFERLQMFKNLTQFDIELT